MAIKISKLLFVFTLMLLLVRPILAEEIQATTPPAEEAKTSMEEGGEGVLVGEVTAIDMQASTITVKEDNGAEKTFSVVDGETILWKGVEDIALSSIPKGQKAEIGYYTNDTKKLIASWVDLVIEEEAAAPETMDTEAKPVAETPQEAKSAAETPKEDVAK